MNTFYCVTTTVDDRGRAKVAITATKEADACPESTFTETSRKDIYHDWFASRAEAEQFAMENQG